ncbi:MAG: alpha/beta fold hydrolase [Nanoarchaeota archaeon]
MALESKIKALYTQAKKTLTNAYEWISTERDYAIINLAGLVHESVRRKYPIGKENRNLGIKAYDKDPIVLLHGFAQNRGVLIDMAEKIRRKGFEFIFRMDYKYYKSIDEIIKNLDYKIKNIINETKCNTKKVSLIGHSEGGLVARDYSIKHPENVDYCIMVGTPNKGTYVAIPGYFLALLLKHSPISKLLKIKFDSASAYQMIPGTQKTPNVKENGVKYFSIYSKYDEAVIKKDSEIVPFAINILIEEFGVKYRGHIALIHDTKIIDGICSILNGEFKRDEVKNIA